MTTRLIEETTAIEHFTKLCKEHSNNVTETLQLMTKKELNDLTLFITDNLKVLNFYWNNFYENEDFLNANKINKEIKSKTNLIKEINALEPQNNKN